MNVRELIEALSTMPDDYPVMQRMGHFLVEVDGVRQTNSRAFIPNVVILSGEE